MKKEKSESRQKEALRRRAEKQHAAEGIGEMSMDDTRRLVQELQVHQIELEMQNEELRRAQQELEESRSRYSDLYDFAPVGYFTFDEKLLVHEVNLTGATLLGIERSTLLKKPFPLFIAPEYHDAFYLHRQQVIKTGIRQACEICVVRKDGSRFFAQLESTAVKEPAGKPGHCRTVLTDITERQQAEDALCRANDELELRVQERTAELDRANKSLQEEVLEHQKAAEEVQDLYNNAPCGYHSLDTDGTFVRINNTELSWLGYSRDELIGKKKFTDIITAKSQEVFKKSFPRFKERGIVTDLEFEMVRRDGTILPVNLNATAVTDSAGNYVLSRATMFDITQRKRAEKDIRGSEARFRSLIHTAPVIIISLSPDGTILEFNPEAELVYGRTREEVLGKNYSDLFIAEESRERMVYRIQGILGGKEFINAEMKLRHVDGTLCYYLWNAERIFDQQGVPSGIIAVGYDITKRKLAEERLRESEKRLKFLSAELIRAQEKERKRIASELHDSIAGSLGTAILGLGRARRALPENTQEHEFISRAITMVKHTVEETRRLVNLLRPPMLDDFGLLPTITWFLDQYSAVHSCLAINKDVAVEDAEIPEGMKIDIYRIIQEAFTNIAKHSNASAVELSLKKKGDVIELTIADNGNGFKPDAIHIRDSGFSGLGLVSLKERAQLSGGTLLINSVVEKGTTIFVQWPASA